MPLDPKYIEKLKKVIRATHDCGSRHFTTVPVTQTFCGKIAWHGDVEVFDLIKHPKAQHCYAWAYQEGGAMHTTAVLGLSPVDSAESAVKVARAAQAKK
jgi:hypothetical protein